MLDHWHHTVVRPLSFHLQAPLERRILLPRHDPVPGYYRHRRHQRKLIGTPSDTDPASAVQPNDGDEAQVRAFLRRLNSGRPTSYYRRSMRGGARKELADGELHGAWPTTPFSRRGSFTKDSGLSGGGDGGGARLVGASWWEVVGIAMRRGLAWISEALSAVWEGVNAVFWSMHGL